MSRPRLIALATELQELIADYLPTSGHLARFSQTCKSLHAVCLRLLAHRLLRQTFVGRLVVHDDLALLLPGFALPFRLWQNARLELRTLISVTRNPFLCGRITFLEFKFADCVELSRELGQVYLPRLELLTLLKVRVQDVEVLEKLINRHKETLRYLFLIGVRVEGRKDLSRQWRGILEGIRDCIRLWYLCITAPYKTSRRWAKATDW